VGKSVYFTLYLKYRNMLGVYRVTSHRNQLHILHVKISAYQQISIVYTIELILVRTIKTYVIPCFILYLNTDYLLFYGSIFSIYRSI